MFHGIEFILQYSCLDTSFLSRNIMHPFWNYCVQVYYHRMTFNLSKCHGTIDFFAPFKFFPRWIAPNVLTFTGFLLTIVNFLLIGFYDFDFNAANDHTRKVIPDWVWMVASFNIFLAYTLGKHYLFSSLFCVSWNMSNHGHLNRLVII